MTIRNGRSRKDPSGSGIRGGRSRRELPVDERIGEAVRGGVRPLESGSQALELELAFKSAHLSNYKEYAYDVGGNLIDIDIYDSSAKALLIFHKDLVYDGNGYLISSVLTRVSDGATLTKTYTYAGADLASVDVVAA